MAESKWDYGLGDLQQHRVSIKSASGTDRLEIKVWGGTLRFGVYHDKEYRPYFERPITLPRIPLVMDALDKLPKLSPGVKYPLVLSVWDNVEKKFAMDWVLTFLKDTSNIYHIEVQWKGNKCDFALKGPFGVSYGSDPMKDDEKSAVGLEELVYYLKYIAPVQMTTTNKRRVPDGAGGGKSGGGKNDTTDDVGDFPF